MKHDECKEAETKLTGKEKTQNSHGRLSTLKHLEALGLECKTNGKGKTTRGKGPNIIKNDFKALNQSEK